MLSKFIVNFKFKLGKQQHYVLGQYLRERYAKMLENGDYSVDKVFVQSTVCCDKKQQSNTIKFQVVFSVVWMLPGHWPYINVSCSMSGRIISAVGWPDLEYQFKMATNSGIFLFISFQHQEKNISIEHFIIIIITNFRYIQYHVMKIVCCHRKNNAIAMNMKWLSLQIPVNINQYLRRIKYSLNIWKRILVENWIV